MRVANRRGKAFCRHLVRPPLRQLTVAASSNNVQLPYHLPLSPLMDPAYNAAKQRHHGVKAEVDQQQLSDFQKKLYKNPYALALATPVRECNASRLRLPKYFLQGYNLMKRNDQDEQAWWLPKDLGDRMTKSRATKCAEQGSALTADTSTSSPNKVADQTSQSTSSATYKSNARGISVYTLSSQSFLRNMVKKSAFMRAFEDTQNANHLRSRQLKRASNFRKDAESFNLELMRRRVVEDLSRLITLKRGYLTHINTDVQKRQIGAFLYIGNVPWRKPKEFSTLDVGNAKIPVYDLTVLLGVQKLEGLKKAFENRMFDKEMLGLRHKRMTVELQMRLWKLQGYLAEYKEFMSEG